MSQNASDRIQEAVKNYVSEVDQEYLRKLQAEMHRCAAKCCEDRVSSPESVNRCVENCGIKLRDAQQFIQNELNSFQDRLQRCFMACGDNFKDKLGSNPNEREIDRYRGELDLCGNKCAEVHVELISTILKRTKETLGKKEFQTSFY